MKIYYFCDDSENRTYVVIHYLLEKDSGVRIRNSIYVDKSQWVAEQRTRSTNSSREGNLDAEQARIARHLGERGIGLTDKDFTRVTKDDYYEKTSFVRR